MLHIDYKYISLLSSHLRNFKQKKPTLYNFSCPICGDSEKNKKKARGYFIQKPAGYYFHCHNCSISLSLGHFLKRVSPALYEEYVLENYKGNTPIQQPKKIKKPAILKKWHPKLAEPVSKLSEKHYVKEYVEARMIPNKYHDILYFTSDFANLCEELFPGKYSSLKEKDARLVLPFFDNEKNVIGLQGRALDGDEKLRYITASADENVQLIYGIDRVDLAKRVYVVEGPIDSLFLPNALAAANADLERVFINRSGLTDVVLVYDNESRNIQVMKLMEKAIDNGRTVCIFPEYIKQKDINDIIRSGVSSEKLLEIINDNLYTGLRAKLRFYQWRKC